MKKLRIKRTFELHHIWVDGISLCNTISLHIDYTSEQIFAWHQENMWENCPKGKGNNNYRVVEEDCQNPNFRWVSYACYWCVLRRQGCLTMWRCWQNVCVQQAPKSTKCRTSMHSTTVMRAWRVLTFMQDTRTIITCACVNSSACDVAVTS